MVTGRVLKPVEEEQPITMLQHTVFDVYNSLKEKAEATADVVMDSVDDNWHRIRRQVRSHSTLCKSHIALLSEIYIGGL